MMVLAGVVWLNTWRWAVIHASRIDRLVRAGRFEQLLDEVLTNGRRLPIAARAMLLEGGESESRELAESGSCVSGEVSLGVLEQASMGLALQRLVELTYVPHPLAVGLARRLLAGLSHRRRGGSTASGGALTGGALAARVMAIAGLVDLVDQCVHTREAAGIDSLGAGGAGVDALIDELGCELSHAVAQSVATRGARGEGLIRSDALSTCLVVWQLRPRAALCASLQRFVNVAAILRVPQRLGLWRDGDCAAVLALAGGVMTEATLASVAGASSGGSGGWRAA